MNKAKIDHLIVERLWGMYWSRWICDSFYAGAVVGDILRYKPAEYVSEFNKRRETKSWNFGRVRYFYDAIKAGKPIEPVIVDNYCDGGHIYPEPLLDDGHHRLVAHHFAKARTIPAYYSGRIDLLNYLKGKRKSKPTTLGYQTCSIVRSPAGIKPIPSSHIALGSMKKLKGIPNLTVFRCAPQTWILEHLFQEFDGFRHSLPRRCCGIPPDHLLGNQCIFEGKSGRHHPPRSIGGSPASVSRPW